jgi:hypothetical protein
MPENGVPPWPCCAITTPAAPQLTAAASIARIVPCNLVVIESLLS